MSKLKFGEKEFEINITPQEIRVVDFEFINMILNDEKKDQVEKYLDIFPILGFPEDVIETMPVSNFIKSINFLKEKFKTELNFQKEIEIDGYIYQSYIGEEFELFIKETKFIEKFIKRNPSKFVAEILAIIFKRKDLTKTEHFDMEHIKHKAKIFRENLYMDLALPFIKKVCETLIIEFSLLND